MFFEGIYGVFTLVGLGLLCLVAFVCILLAIKMGKKPRVFTNTRNVDVITLDHLRQAYSTESNFDSPPSYEQAVLQNKTDKNKK